MNIETKTVSDEVSEYLKFGWKHTEDTSKRKIDVEVSKNESILSVISFGYGETQGVVRKSKKPEEVSIVIGEKPILV